MKAVLIRPNEAPTYVDTDGRLGSLQALCGGYIQAVPLGPGLDMYVDEDGKYKPENFHNHLATLLVEAYLPGFMEVDHIVGAAVVLGCDPDGDTTSASDEVYDHAMRLWSV